MADSNSAENNGFKVIGTRPIRHDGFDKVTGRAKYGADYVLPGMLHGKVLRSPHAHARIKSINCEKALKVPAFLPSSRERTLLPPSMSSLPLLASTEPTRVTFHTT